MPATATIGVAMDGHRSGISGGAADMVLPVNDVTRVDGGMLKVARQRICVGLTFGLMGFAAFALMPEVAKVLVQESVDVLVILNALRAREVNA